MTNAKKPTAAMVEAGVRAAGPNVSAAQVRAILSASLEPAAPVEDGEVRHAIERLEAWARLIERPSPDGDDRLAVDADVAAEHARDIRTLIASQPPAADALVSAAIHLRRSGDYAIVSIILPDGREVELIRERADGCFGHIIEPSGIARAVKEAR